MKPYHFVLALLFVACLAVSAQSRIPYVDSQTLSGAAALIQTQWYALKWQAGDGQPFLDIECLPQETPPTPIPKLESRAIQLTPIGFDYDCVTKVGAKLHLEPRAIQSPLQLCIGAKCATASNVAGFILNQP